MVRKFVVSISHIISIAFSYCCRTCRDYWVEVVLRSITFSATMSKTLFKKLKAMKVNLLPCYVRNL